MFKVRGLDLLLSALLILPVGAAWAQTATPSADDMIRQLGTPPAPDAGQTRGFRVQTEDTPAAGGKPASRPASAPEAARPQIGVPLLFDLDSDRLKPESAPTVSTIARALQSPQLIRSKILIEGHTDASGNAAHNLALSKRRADAVKAALVHDGGVESARLSTIGKGQTGLANTADPLAAENRRVVLVNVSD